MNCLLDRFLSCKASDVLWVAEAVGPVNITRLTQAFSCIDPSGWQGKRVAIGALPVLEFVTTLAFLDGLAQAIVLLPTEDDQTTRESRLTQANIDIVIEGHGLDFVNLLAQFDVVAANGAAQLVVPVRPAGIQTTWLLPTSGTTGTPKLIAHTFVTLTRSMTKRRIGGDYTWGSFYSLRRFAGLQVFLQSWMCGTPLILCEEGADLHDVLTRFIDLGCNALSATPSMWRKLAMHPLFDRLSLKQITLGGEIVDQSILDMLANCFPGARITHIYASTEAGVGFAVRDGIAGFPVDYLLQPPSGVAMRIDGQNHLWFGTKLPESVAVGPETGWIDSGDLVEMQGARVCFLGRANGSINVGGNKVMPEEIESVIKELPNVGFVQVRARKSAILGNLVEAAITPTPGNVFDATFKKQVTAHCRARLDGFKVPAFIVAADDIKLTASGKLSRTDLR
jgi:acyl-CoA synthetase (AMP-forming)/AMP-acid ligase II